MNMKDRIKFNDAMLAAVMDGRKCRYMDILIRQ